MLPLRTPNPELSSSRRGRRGSPCSPCELLRCARQTRCGRRVTELRTPNPELRTLLDTRPRV